METKTGGSSGTHKVSSQIMAVNGDENKTRIIDVINTMLRQSFLDSSYQLDGWHLDTVTVISNEILNNQYWEKRVEMESHGADLQESLLFACYRGNKFVDMIEMEGLGRNISSKFNYVGDPSRGILLCRHADIQMKAAKIKQQDRCWLFVFRTTCGRTVSIEPDKFANHNATSSADCHVTISQPSKHEPLYQQAVKSQVYLYDPDPTSSNGYAVRPRQCTPILNLVYCKNSSKTLTTINYRSIKLRPPGTSTMNSSIVDLTDDNDDEVSSPVITIPDDVSEQPAVTTDNNSLGVTAHQVIYQLEDICSKVVPIPYVSQLVSNTSIDDSVAGSAGISASPSDSILSSLLLDDTVPSRDVQCSPSNVTTSPIITPPVRFVTLSAAPVTPVMPRLHLGQQPIRPHQVLVINEGANSRAAPSLRQGASPVLQRISPVPTSVPLRAVYAIPRNDLLTGNNEVPARMVYPPASRAQPVQGNTEAQYNQSDSLPPPPAYSASCMPGMRVGQQSAAPLGQSADMRRIIRLAAPVHAARPVNGVPSTRPATGYGQNVGTPPAARHTITYVPNASVPGTASGLPMRFPGHNVTQPDSRLPAATAQNATLAAATSLLSADRFVRPSWSARTSGAYYLMSGGTQTIPRGTQNLPGGTQTVPCGTQNLGWGSQTLQRGTENLRWGNQTLQEGTQNLGWGNQTLQGGTQNLPGGTQNLQRIVWPRQANYLPRFSAASPSPLPRPLSSVAQPSRPTISLVPAAPRARQMISLAPSVSPASQNISLIPAVSQAHPTISLIPAVSQAHPTISRVPALEALHTEAIAEGTNLIIYSTLTGSGTPTIFSTTPGPVLDLPGTRSSADARFGGGNPFSMNVQGMRPIVIAPLDEDEDVMASPPAPPPSSTSFAPAPTFTPAPAAQAQGATNIKQEFGRRSRRSTTIVIDEDVVSTSDIVSSTCGIDSVEHTPMDVTDVTGGGMTYDELMSVMGGDTGVEIDPAQFNANMGGDTGVEIDPAQLNNANQSAFRDPAASTDVVSAPVVTSAEISRTVEESANDDPVQSVAANAVGFSRSFINALVCPRNEVANPIADDNCRSEQSTAVASVVPLNSLSTASISEISIVSTPPPPPSPSPSLSLSPPPPLPFSPVPSDPVLDHQISVSESEPDQLQPSTSASSSTNQESADEFIDLYRICVDDSIELSKIALSAVKHAKRVFSNEANASNDSGHMACVVFERDMPYVQRTAMMEAIQGQFDTVMIIDDDDACLRNINRHSGSNVVNEPSNGDVNNSRPHRDLIEGDVLNTDDEQDRSTVTAGEDDNTIAEQLSLFDSDEDDDDDDDDVVQTRIEVFISSDEDESITQSIVSTVPTSNVENVGSLTNGTPELTAMNVPLDSTTNSIDCLVSAAHDLDVNSRDSETMDVCDNNETREESSGGGSEAGSRGASCAVSGVDSDTGSDEVSGVIIEISDAVNVVSSVTVGDAINGVDNDTISDVVNVVGSDTISDAVNIVGNVTVGEAINGVGNDMISDAVNGVGSDTIRDVVSGVVSDTINDAVDGVSSDTISDAVSGAISEAVAVSGVSDAVSGEVNVTSTVDIPASLTLEKSVNTHMDRITSPERNIDFFDASCDDSDSDSLVIDETSYEESDTASTVNVPSAGGNENERGGGEGEGNTLRGELKDTDDTRLNQSQLLGTVNVVVHRQNDKDIPELDTSLQGRERSEIEDSRMEIDHNLNVELPQAGSNRSEMSRSEAGTNLDQIDHSKSGSIEEDVDHCETDSILDDTGPSETGSNHDDIEPSVTGSILDDSEPSETGSIHGDIEPSVTGSILDDSEPSETGSIHCDIEPSVMGSILDDSEPSDKGSIDDDIEHSEAGSNRDDIESSISIHNDVDLSEAGSIQDDDELSESGGNQKVADYSDTDSIQDNADPSEAGSIAEVEHSGTVSVQDNVGCSETNSMHDDVDLSKIDINQKDIEHSKTEMFEKGKEPSDEAHRDNKKKDTRRSERLNAEGSLDVMKASEVGRGQQDEDSDQVESSGEDCEPDEDEGSQVEDTSDIMSIEKCASDIASIEKDVENESSVLIQFPDSDKDGESNSESSDESDSTQSDNDGGDNTEDCLDKIELISTERSTVEINQENDEAQSGTLEESEATVSISSYSDTPKPLPRTPSMIYVPLTEPISPNPYESQFEPISPPSDALGLDPISPGPNELVLDPCESTSIQIGLPFLSGENNCRGQFFQEKIDEIPAVFLTQYSTGATTSDRDKYNDNTAEINDSNMLRVAEANTLVVSEGVTSIVTEEGDGYNSPNDIDIQALYDPVSPASRPTSPLPPVYSQNICDDNRITADPGSAMYNTASPVSQPTSLGSLFFPDAVHNSPMLDSVSSTSDAALLNDPGALSCQDASDAPSGHLDTARCMYDAVSDVSEPSSPWPSEYPPIVSGEVRNHPVSSLRDQNPTLVSNQSAFNYTLQPSGSDPSFVQVVQNQDSSVCVGGKTDPESKLQDQSVVTRNVFESLNNFNSIDQVPVKKLPSILKTPSAKPVPTKIKFADYFKRFKALNLGTEASQHADSAKKPDKQTAEHVGSAATENGIDSVRSKPTESTKKPDKQTPEHVGSAAAENVIDSVRSKPTESTKKPDKQTPEHVGSAAAENVIDSVSDNPTDSVSSPVISSSSLTTSCEQSGDAIQITQLPPSTYPTSEDIRNTTEVLDSRSPDSHPSTVISRIKGLPARRWSVSPLVTDNSCSSPLFLPGVVKQVSELNRNPTRHLSISPNPQEDISTDYQENSRPRYISNLVEPGAHSAVQVLGSRNSPNASTKNMDLNQLETSTGNNEVDVTSRSRRRTKHDGGKVHHASTSIPIQVKNKARLSTDASDYSQRHKKIHSAGKGVVWKQFVSIPGEKERWILNFVAIDLPEVVRKACSVNRELALTVNCVIIPLECSDKDMPRDPRRPSIQETDAPPVPNDQADNVTMSPVECVTPIDLVVPQTIDAAMSVKYNDIVDALTVGATSGLTADDLMKILATAESITSNDIIGTQTKSTVNYAGSNVQVDASSYADSDVQVDTQIKSTAEHGLFSNLKESSIPSLLVTYDDTKITSENLHTTIDHEISFKSRSVTRIHEVQTELKSVLTEQNLSSLTETNPVGVKDGLHSDSTSLASDTEDEGTLFIIQPDDDDRGIISLTSSMEQLNTSQQTVSLSQKISASDNFLSAESLVPTLASDAVESVNSIYSIGSKSFISPPATNPIVSKSTAHSRSFVPFDRKKSVASNNETTISSLSSAAFHSHIVPHSDVVQWECLPETTPFHEPLQVEPITIESGLSGLIDHTCVVPILDRFLPAPSQAPKPQTSQHHQPTSDGGRLSSSQLSLSSHYSRLLKSQLETDHPLSRDVKPRASSINTNLVQSSNVSNHTSPSKSRRRCPRRVVVPPNSSKISLDNTAAIGPLSVQVEQVIAPVKSNNSVEMYSPSDPIKKCSPVKQLPKLSSEISLDKTVAIDLLSVQVTPIIAPVKSNNSVEMYSPSEPTRKSSSVKLLSKLRSDTRDVEMSDASASTNQSKSVVQNNTEIERVSEPPSSPQQSESEPIGVVQRTRTESGDQKISIGQAERDVLDAIVSFIRLPSSELMSVTERVTQSIAEVMQCVNDEQIFCELTSHLSDAEKETMQYSMKDPLVVREIVIDKRLDTVRRDVTRLVQQITINSASADPKNQIKMDRLSRLKLTCDLLYAQMNRLRLYHKSRLVFVLPNDLRVQREYDRMISIDGSLLFVQKQTISLHHCRRLYCLRIEIEDAERERNMRCAQNASTEDVDMRLACLNMKRNNLLSEVCCNSATELEHLIGVFSTHLKACEQVITLLDYEKERVRVDFVNNQYRLLKNYIDIARNVEKSSCTTHSVWQQRDPSRRTTTTTTLADDSMSNIASNERRRN